jgi:N,N-dimethylformamidase beta subunit-like protein
VARALSLRVRVGLVCVALLVLGAPPLERTALAAGNPVVTENQQAGSSGWLLGSQIADDVNGQIKGYTSATSVAQGQSLALYVSVNPAQTFGIDFYRIGWYGGLGGRHRLHVGPLEGTRQNDCPVAADTGLIACGWTASYSLAVPSDWTSGVYLALLTNAAGYQNVVLFVVRDGRPAQFLYQHAVTTDEAFNNYPDDGQTGKSLYAYNSYGANTVAGDKRAVKVSFDRPFAGAGTGFFFSWEVQLVRWLERSGYDVTYSTDLDTHSNGGELRNHRAFLSAGYDAFWSKQMYDAADAARDAGVNLAFLGAHAVYWQVRFEPSASGAADRVMVCYKVAGLDPVQGPTTTAPWHTSPLDRPEQALAGVQYTSESPFGNNAGYVVADGGHWLFAGTGLKTGDSVPGIVGHLVDRFMPEFPEPDATSRTILSDSPVTTIQGTSDHSNSSIYRAPSGALVFAAGTLSWSWGLDGLWNNVADARIQRITSNLFDAFISGPPVDHLAVVAPASVAAGEEFALTVTAADPSGDPVAEYGGRIHFSSSDTSSGAALPPDSPLASGRDTFTLRLGRAGPQTVTVSDPARSLSATVNITVVGGGATHLAVTTTATPTAGTSFSFTVTAQDDSGNTDTSYAGTVHFATSDGSSGVVLPADSTLTGGRGTFSATLNKAGVQTVTATDTTTASVTGIVNVNVRAAIAATVTVDAPATATGGEAFNVTVTLRDRFGNVATGYAGTVRFKTTDPLGSVPGDYAFTEGDAGAHTFSVTLRTVTTPLNRHTITVTDRTDPALSGRSSPIAVALGLGL